MATTAGVWADAKAAKVRLLKDIDAAIAKCKAGQASDLKAGTKANKLRERAYSLARPAKVYCKALSWSQGHAKARASLCSKICHHLYAAAWEADKSVVLFTAQDTGTQYRVCNAKDVLKDFRRRIERGFPTTSADVTIKTREVVPEAKCPPPSVGSVPKTRPAGKDIAKIIGVACSTDPNREPLQKVLIDPEHKEAIATDGKRMIVALNVEGVKGETFEKYRYAVPGYVAGGLPDTSLINGAVALDVSTEELARKCRLVIASLDKEDDKWAEVAVHRVGDGVEFVYSCSRGKLKTITKIDGDGRRHRVQEPAEYDRVETGRIPDGSVAVVNLSARLLLGSVVALRRLGNERVRFVYPGEPSPVMLIGAEEYAVQMPIRSENNRGFVQDRPHTARKTCS